MVESQTHILITNLDSMDMILMEKHLQYCYQRDSSALGEIVSRRGNILYTLRSGIYKGYPVENRFDRGIAHIYDQMGLSAPES